MAVHFDGAGASYLRSLSAAPALAQNATWTLGVWVEITADRGDFQSIYGLYKTANVGVYGDFALYLRGAGTYAANVGRWEFDGSALSGGAALLSASYGADTTWRLVVIKNDGSGGLTYYTAIENGAPVAEDTDSLSTDLTQGTGSHNGRLWLGGSDIRAAQAASSLAQFFFTPNALTVDEIAQLAAGATVGQLGYTPDVWYKLDTATDLTDYGSAGNDLTVTGAPTTVAGPAVLVPSGTPVSVTLGFGARAWAGLAPTIQAGAKPAIGSQALTLATFAPQIKAGWAATLGPRSLTATGYAPGVQTGAGVSVGLGTQRLTAAGQPPSLALGHQLGLSAGHLAVTRYAPTVTVGHGVRAMLGAGAYSVAGKSPSLSLGYSAALGAQTLTINGRSVSVDAGWQAITPADTTWAAITPADTTWSKQ